MWVAFWNDAKGEKYVFEKETDKEMAECLEVLLDPGLDVRNLKVVSGSVVNPLNLINFFKPK